MQFAEEATDHMLEEAIQFMEVLLENAGYEEQKVDEIIKYINYYIRSVCLSETNEIPTDITITLPWWLAVFLILFFVIVDVLNDIYYFLACGNKSCKDFEPGDKISDACYNICCGPNNIGGWPICE